MHHQNVEHPLVLRLPRLIVVGVLSVFAACSPAEAPQAKGEPPPDSAASLTEPHTACWLVSVAEVSSALGEPVHPVADLGGMEYGHSGCSYFAGEDGSGKRLLTLGLDWDGFITQSMQFPRPGPATEKAPYADIGDGAVLTSGVLFVRIGRRSLAIDARDAGDLHALSERLIVAARPKMMPLQNIERSP